MNAVSEIGWKKAFRFALGEIEKGLLKICWLPNIRTFLLRLFGATIGKETIILNAEFINLHRAGFRGLFIGDYCFVGDGCLFDLADKIMLHNHCSLSQRVVINTHLNVGYKNHPLQKKFPAFSKPVEIQKNCFLGIGTIVLAGITIGQDSFVGAASLVNKNVPANSVVAGVPIRPLQKK